MKLSYADVLTKAMTQGLSFHAATEVADEACPEYSMCTESKANKLIKEASKR
jgi:hypothetical protein